MPRLDDADIQSRLSAMSGWSVENGQLSKVFEFGAYLEGVRFATQIANEAESMDHHPDLLITWRKVKVSVSTHSEGGITDKDFALAAVCDKHA